MKLYGSLTSPYVRKARILLMEKGIPCELVLADPWAPDSIVPSLNPLGKIPVLELDSGEILFDSPVVVEYLDTLRGEPLIPPSGRPRWDVLRWHALAQGMLDATVARLLETRRSLGQRSAENIARQEAKIARALEYADRAFQGQAYLNGGAFSLADLALGVALRYIDFRYPHPWRDRHPRLGRWLAGITARSSFVETEPPGMERTVDAPR